jgi:hypothetical protein
VVSTTRIIAITKGQIFKIISEGLAYILKCDGEEGEEDVHYAEG